MKVVYHSLFFLILWSSASLLKAHEPKEFFEIIDISKGEWCEMGMDEETLMVQVKGTTKDYSPGKGKIMCVAFDRDGNELSYNENNQDNFYTSILISMSCKKVKKFNSAKCFDPNK